MVYLAFVLLCSCFLACHADQKIGEILNCIRKNEKVILNALPDHMKTWGIETNSGCNFEEFKYFYDELQHLKQNLPTHLLNFEHLLKNLQTQSPKRHPACHGPLKHKINKKDFLHNIIKALQKLNRETLIRVKHFDRQ